MEEEDCPEGLPAYSSLFVLDAPSRQPWWRAYFGIQRDLPQASKGALVILPAAGRVFALTFGHVAHNLKEDSYEYDFGLRVTLNCVDPKKLKNTDVLEPGAARRQRTQVAIDSDLTYFDFDRDSKILQSLTGKAKAEHRHIINHATGASNLRINTRVAANELIGLCEQLLALYASDAYLATFPDIHNVTPVRDPNIVQQLNATLLDGFRQKSPELYLAVPELVDYHEGLYVAFTGAGESKIYTDVLLDRYYEYLAVHERPLQGIDLETLRRHALTITTEDGQPRKAHSIFKSLVFDATDASTGKTHHLAEGQWYCVASSYVDRLREYLDPRCVPTSLPAYVHANEGDYNAAVAATSDAYTCLDKTDISLTGQTMIEPCDLYALEDENAVLHHVKVSTFSADLSHLFNQGLNAVQLLKLEKQAREKLTALLRDKLGDGCDPLLAPVIAERFAVSFAIVTHKDASQKSNNLPLFSRISLMRALKSLQVMGVPATFGFVVDSRPKVEGKKKPRKKKQAASGNLAS